MPPRDTLIPSDANRAMFDGIAHQYDHMNQLMSLGLHKVWRRRAVLALAPQPTRTYLEIGSGTGDLIIELLRQQPAARIIGVDPSDNMNRIAQEKLTKLFLANQVSLVTSDFMTFTPPNGLIDGVISAFCIRNLEHLDQALIRMRTVTKPGGKVLALELTRSDSAILRLLCKLYNRTVLPLLASMAGETMAYRYLADSIDHFPSASSIRQRFQTAGLRHVTSTPMTGGAVTLFAGTVE